MGTANLGSTRATGGDPKLDMIPLQINGQDVATDILFDVSNPATGQAIWRCCGASAVEVEAAAEAAQTAFQTWSKTKPAYRRDILLKAATIFNSRADECRRIMMEEMGAESTFFDHINLPLTVELIQDCAGRIASAITGSVPMAADEGTGAMILKVPYGVVLGISPW